MISRHGAQGFYPGGKPRKSISFRRTAKKLADPTRAELELRRRLIEEYLEKNGVNKLAPGFSHMDW